MGNRREPQPKPAGIVRPEPPLAPPPAALRRVLDRSMPLEFRLLFSPGFCCWMENARRIDNYRRYRFKIRVKAKSLEE